MWILKVLLVLAAIIGGFILINKLNKIRAKKPYADYYAKKRKEFPWLDNWINENVNPAELRANEGASSSTVVSIILFVIFGVIGGIILLFSGSLVAFFVSVAIGLGIGELMARKNLKDPTILENEEVGLTLECPSCGCPHSWVLLEEENVVEEIETTTETTTRSGYGQGDFIDWSMEGFKQNGTTVKETTVYYGRTERDFKCENCGHTEHNEYKAFWKYEPNSQHIVHNPPKPAWMTRDVARQAAEKRANKLYEQVKSTQTGSPAETAPNTPAETASTPNFAGLNNPEDLFLAGKKADDNKDYAMSFPLFLKAAEMNHCRACGYVAMSYRYGQGVEKDYAKAIMWYEKELEIDKDEAFLTCSAIGELYRDGGYGIQRDLEKARYWFQLDVDTYDDDDAKKALKELKKLK